MANKNKGASPQSVSKKRGGSMDAQYEAAKRDREGRDKFRKDTTYGMSPQDWEKETGNKLLSYQTSSDGMLMKGPMSFKKTEQIEDMAMKLGLTEKSTTPQGQTMYSKPAATTAATTEDESAARSSGLLKSAYEQVMGRAAGGTQGLFQGDSQTLGRGGFYGSMPALEAASMRLADAALKREMLGAEYKGTQETRLQQLRGSQETGLQQLRGSQETGLQQLRGSQEMGLQGLRGTQETALTKFRADQEAKFLGYTSSDAMARDIASRREEEDRKRREEEYAQKMRSQGYELVGGRWMLRYK